MVLITYSLGCLWFWYVKRVDDEKYSKLNFIDDNFLLDDAHNYSKVLRSCYFILTTISTVGYGDYLPKNPSEYALLGIIMLLGVGVFAYIMGSFNSAV
jgi:hypothetical protein